MTKKKVLSSGSMYPIEKRVPIPESRSHGKYPFKGMAVGDSFFVPGIRQRDISGLYSYYNKRGWKLTSRREGDGVRVWRIK